MRSLCERPPVEMCPFHTHGTSKFDNFEADVNYTKKLKEKKISRTVWLVFKGEGRSSKSTGFIDTL